MKTKLLISLLAAGFILGGCQDKPEAAPIEETSTLPAPPPSPSAQPASAPAQSAPRAVSSTGEGLYRSCIPCHGQDGRTVALGRGEAIAGWEEAKLIEVLTGYRNGTLNRHGMGGMMSSQTTRLSDADIAALAEYINGL